MEWARKSLGTFFAAVAVSLAALAWNPGQAYALEPGQCASPQALSAELREEGEGNPFAFVATMESIAVDVENGGETAMLAQFVAANQDRSRFYILTGDVPLNEPAEEFCVTMAGHNLEINDYRQDRPPRLTNNFTFDQHEARQQCEAVIENVGNVTLCTVVIRGYVLRPFCEAFRDKSARVQCGHRDTMLERANELHDERIALQGILLSPSGKDSGLLTVTASPVGEQHYFILTSGDKGATIGLDSGTAFSFTSPVIAQLEQAQ